MAGTLHVPMQGLLATIELLDEGSTVPFIARYRKESTGNLDEVQIRAIEEKLLYFRELISRKETILASIHEQGKLTDELKATIKQTLDRSELEDLYLPYKPKRRTKATIAREKGLGPLADYLWSQEPTGTPLDVFAASFVDAAKGVASVEDALEGARHILAETISDEAGIRKLLRRAMFEEGVIVSKKAIDAVDEQQKLRCIRVSRTSQADPLTSHARHTPRRDRKRLELPHRTRPATPARPYQEQDPQRARRLDFPIEPRGRRCLEASAQHFHHFGSPPGAQAACRHRRHPGFPREPPKPAARPPAGQLAVLGLDPGIRTGCKVAVVNDTGKFLGHDVIYPFQPKNDAAGAERTLRALIEKFNVRAIAIGNGTASRETDAFVRDFSRKKDSRRAVLRNRQ